MSETSRRFAVAVFTVVVRRLFVSLRYVHTTSVAVAVVIASVGVFAAPWSAVADPTSGSARPPHAHNYQVARTITLPAGASIQVDASSVAHQIDAQGNEVAQRALPVSPGSTALDFDRPGVAPGFSDDSIRMLFAPAPTPSTVIATLAPGVVVTGPITPNAKVPGQRSAVTSNASVNAAFAAVGARTAAPLLPQVPAGELGGLAAGASRALGNGAPDLTRTVVVEVAGDPQVASTALRGTPGVTFAEPARAVVGMSNGATPLPAAASTATSDADSDNPTVGVATGVYGNYALRTSLSSYLNASGVDAVPAWSTLTARAGALPGTGTRITNVSVGDLTDASMAASDPYVAHYGPTTVVQNGQRYLDLPSMPLIPTYTASGAGTLDPLGSTENQDPSLGEVMLDFGVMAPLPRSLQRPGAKGFGDTNLIGIAPGASYRLVVPQIPTTDQIAVALIGAARQNPKPDVITASLGFGTDVVGYPGRYLEDDPVTQSVVAGIVNAYGITVCISSNDGTRLIYSPTAVGPDGGSTPTDRTTNPSAATTIDDVAYSTTPSKVLDSGAIAVGATTLDDTLAEPLGPTGRGNTNGTFATTRIDGAGSYSSGFGSRINVSAPGDGIPAFTHRRGGGPNAVVPVLNGGTSASAPMVAAAAALVVQAAKLAGHPYNPAQVRDVLTSTARAVATPKQTDRQLNVGAQIDAGAAVAAALGASGPNSPAAATEAASGGTNLAIVRVSMAHRITQPGYLGGAFTEFSDPDRLDLQGPNIAGPREKPVNSGEGLVGPVTFGMDVTGLAPGTGATYSMTVGSTTWKSSTPTIRITPTELLTAAGQPVVSGQDRAVDYKLTVTQGNAKTSVTRSVVVSPSDGTYVEAVAPITAPVVSVGQGTTVSWDLRGVAKNVDGFTNVYKPTLLVSTVGHWNPVLGPIFSAGYRVPLEGDHGTVQIPASAFASGGGIYGIGIAQHTTTSPLVNGYGEFVAVRVAAASADQRPPAPLLAGTHTAFVPRTAPTFKLAYDVTSVPGATSAMYEVSAPGPTLFGSLNTVTNQNGTQLDHDGVNAGSVAHAKLPARSGTVTLDASKFGPTGDTYNVRVFALDGGGNVVGQASPTSSVSLTGTVAPTGAYFTDLLYAGADSFVDVRSGDTSTIARWNPATDQLGGVVTSDTAPGSGYQFVGVDPSQKRVVVLHYQNKGVDLSVETWSTANNTKIGSRTFNSYTTLVLGGQVDAARHRAVLVVLKNRPAEPDLAIVVDLKTGTVADPVSIDAPDAKAAGYNRVDLDPDTGQFLISVLGTGSVCQPFGSVPIARFNPDTNKTVTGKAFPCAQQSAFAAGHDTLQQLVLSQFSLNLPPNTSLGATDATKLSNNGIFDLTLERGQASSALAVDGPHSLSLSGYASPEPVAVFGSTGGGALLDNNATSQIEVAPLKHADKVITTIGGLNLVTSAAGEWAEETSQPVQIDAATGTGWSISADGSQIQRFTYPTS